MTTLFHALLPMWLWSVIFNRPFLINWHGAWLVDGFLLLIGIVATFPDTLPVIITDHYHLVDRLYTKIHQPWQFGYWWMYILWLIFWPAGLHCLCDIPVHNPDTSIKNLWLDIGSELALLVAIILTRHIWYTGV